MYGSYGIDGCIAGCIDEIDGIDFCSRIDGCIGIVDILPCTDSSTIPCVIGCIVIEG